MATACQTMLEFGSISPEAANIDRPILDQAAVILEPIHGPEDSLHSNQIQIMESVYVFAGSF